ncbi:hypothetical protein ACROYT_G026285 [Oculina patagonica]
MSSWLKEKYGGSGASGSRGRPTSKSSDGEAVISEWELILNRAGIACDEVDSTRFIICPKHRFKLTTLYKAKDKCCHPLHEENKKASKVKKRVTDILKRPRRVNKTMAATIYKNTGRVVAIGSVFSAPSSSSQEEQSSIFLPEDEREKKNLDALNGAMSVISEGKFVPLPSYIEVQWDELSVRIRTDYTEKAEELVSLVLDTIAPSQGENLWQAIIQCHQTLNSSNGMRPVDVGVEAILLAYKECENKSTKTQILSLISDKFSQSQIQELLPGISLRQIKNARKHAQECGPGEPVVKEQIFRCRLDMEKVKDFVYFISRSTFLQDVAFGTKTLKLQSGESIPIPALVRTMTATKIVHLYQEECKAENKIPLKERTCFRLIEVCSASKQKSLQGLDNTSTAVAEAFETLEKLVTNLAGNGAGLAWGHEIERALTAGRQYLKGEFKSHLGGGECCADHCTVFALSDPKKAEFASPCDHSHDMSCSDCQNIKNVLKDIQKKLESKELELTEDQQERAKWEFEHAVSDIEAWKSHLLRAFHQDQARQDALSQLDEKTIIVRNDWAMKLPPMKFRETQSQWFAKRGLSWHFSAVIHNSGHPDCQAEGNGEHVIHTYVAAFDDCKQDWFSVACIIEEVLVTVKETHPTVSKAVLRSDNAGCYHSTSLLTTINSSSKRTGVEVIRYDFSDPQAGKDLCDRKIAPCKQRLRNYVAENNDVQTAEDVKKGLESPPGIAGTRVAVCKIDKTKMSKAVENNKITGITKYYDFSYSQDGIRVWQAYGVGEGMMIEDFQSKQDVSGLERIGEWSHEVTRPKQKKGTTKSKACTSDLTSTYSCLEPSCIFTFSTLEDADEHMDIGCHVMLPENESVYDTGWALKKQKPPVRISEEVKEYLTRVFNEGTRSKLKAKPNDVAEDLKRKFARSDWLEVQTIKGYFSRLAALQKGQEVSEEDTACEDAAIEREELLQDLIEEAQEQIDLQHPLMYEKINLCELFVANKLDHALRKFKLCTLKAMCDSFGVDIDGPATRKAPFITAVFDLVKFCQCQCK